MGKYTALRGKLERAEPEDKGYQEKVDKVKGQSVGAVEARLKELVSVIKFDDAVLKSKLIVKSRTVDELAAMYSMHKAIKASLEATVYANNMVIEALDQLLVQRFDANNTEQLRVEKVGLFTRKDSVYVRIVDREKLLAWGEQEGEDLSQINAGRVASITKERLVEGEDAPPGVECLYGASINFTRAK